MFQVLITTAHLMSKLIAGYTQDNEALGGVAAVELVHLSVVPGCCSSEGRHILNKNHFSSQRREAQDFTRQQFGCQLVELFHITSHGNRLMKLFCAYLPSNVSRRSSPHFLQGTVQNSTYFKRSQVLNNESSYWMSEKSPNDVDRIIMYLICICYWNKKQYRGRHKSEIKSTVIYLELHIQYFILKLIFS